MSNDQWYIYVKGHRLLEVEQSWIESGDAFLWNREFGRYGALVAEKRHGYHPWRFGKDVIFNFQVQLANVLLAVRLIAMGIVDFRRL